MNAPVQLNRFALPTYREGEGARCSQCNGTHWIIGRINAECAHCGNPLPLAHPKA